MKPFAYVLIFGYLFVTFTACTSKEEKAEFVGEYIRKEKTPRAVPIYLHIREDGTYQTNGLGPECQNGNWDVSSLPTSMGIVITLESGEGHFCDQLHWKENAQGNALETQEVDEALKRLYLKNRKKQ